MLGVVSPGRVRGEERAMMVEMEEWLKPARENTP